MQDRIRHQTQQVFTDMSAGLESSPTFLFRRTPTYCVKNNRWVKYPANFHRSGAFPLPFSKRQQAVNAEKKKTHSPEIHTQVSHRPEDQPAELTEHQLSYVLASGKFGLGYSYMRMLKTKRSKRAVFRTLSLRSSPQSLKYLLLVRITLPCS